MIEIKFKVFDQYKKILYPLGQWYFSFSIRSLSQDSSINLRVFYSSFWYITVLKLSKLTHASDREIFMSQTQYPISCSNLSNECHHLFPCSHSVITDPIERKIDQNRNNDFEIRKNRYNSSRSQRVRVSRGDRSTRNVQSRSTASYSVQCVNERFVGWPRMYEIEIEILESFHKFSFFDFPMRSIFFSLFLSLSHVNSWIHWFTEIKFEFLRKFLDTIFTELNFDRYARPFREITILNSKLTRATYASDRKVIFIRCLIS